MHNFYLNALATNGELGCSFAISFLAFQLASSPLPPQVFDAVPKRDPVPDGRVHHGQRVLRRRAVAVRGGAGGAAQEPGGAAARRRRGRGHDAPLRVLQLHPQGRLRRHRREGEGEKKKKQDPVCYAKPQSNDTCHCSECKAICLSLNNNVHGSNVNIFFLMKRCEKVTASPM